MAKRLYYDDAYLREFAATVIRSEPRGELLAVWLDQSGFYPTTGGQPFDTGRLGDASVEGVEEDDSGDVMHLVRATNPDALQPGAAVTGLIDWPRRVDYMQQHTGQHLFSAVIVRLFANPTLSVHLGAAVSTIDLERELTAAQIAEAEQAANRLIAENRPVHIRYASAAEAAAMPLRKESGRTGTLRLIEIEGIDLSACGGTHVARTGAIGAVVANRWERFKGGQRIEFLCGGRTVTRFRALRDTAASLTALLSVQPEEFIATVQRLQLETKDQKRTISELQLELARFQAGELARGAEAHAAGRLVLAAVKGDAEMLKSLAAAIVASPGYIVVLVTEAMPGLIVAARSADLSLSCQQLVAQLTAQFGGRGGGRPTLAQAGGLQASPASILAAARNAIT